MYRHNRLNVLDEKRRRYSAWGSRLDSFRLAPCPAAPIEVEDIEDLKKKKPLNCRWSKMARAGGGRPELFAATQCRHSRTVSTYGFGSVFGAHSLNTISVLFVLVMIEIHPSPARTSRTLLAHSAQGVLARRRQEEPSIMLCSGVSASEFAAPDLSGKLVNQKTPCVYKRPPTLRASTSTVTTCWSSRKTC
jgi:hypothetical protein